jgi:hypothetical protein
MLTVFMMLSSSERFRGKPIVLPDRNKVASGNYQNPIWHKVSVCESGRAHAGVANS